MVKKTLIYILEMFCSIAIMFMQNNGKIANNGAFIIIGILGIIIFTTLFIRAIIKNKKQKQLKQMQNKIIENEYNKINNKTNQE